MFKAIFYFFFVSVSASQRRLHYQLYFSGVLVSAEMLALSTSLFRLRCVFSMFPLLLVVLVRGFKKHPDMVFKVPNVWC